MPQAVLAKFSAGDSDAPVQFRCLFDTMMARFELWLLRRQVDIVTPSAASATMLNSCMTMLASACLKGGQLAARGYSITGFEAACLEVRARLAAAASVRAVAVAKEFELPRTSTIAYKQMTGVIPEAELPVAVGGGLAAARLRSAANLGSLPVLPAGSSFTTLLAFLADETLWLPTATSKDVSQQLALCCVEQELFGKAASGFNNVSLSCSEVDAMVEVVDRYRAQLHAFHESAASQAVMQAGLRSRELLVVWVAYCFTHAATCTEHPVLLKYGAALRYVDLRHLVLSDKAAVDAALSVGAYLQQHTAVVAGTAVAGNAVFSLRDGSEATLCMALEYAEGDPSMGEIWVSELALAEGRKDQHWEQVIKQRADVVTWTARVRHYRGLLPQQTMEAQRARTHFSFFKQSKGKKSDAWKQANRQDTYCQAAVEETSEEISTAETLLSRAQAAPPPLIQPLPHDVKLAMPWIFFLHMPPRFRTLSRMSFLAQQMLLPNPWTSASAAAVAVPMHKMTLLSHYNDRTRSQYSRQPSAALVQQKGMVYLISGGQAPTAHGPSSVDKFTDKSEGVWYPDTLAPEMAWGGSGLVVDVAKGHPACFNPFAAAVDQKLVELTFTETLRDEVSLQWAMHQSGSRVSTPADRGNLAIAQQDMRPGWLSKPGYLTLGNLRAYPLGQLRQLCVALHERNLPLGRPAVQILVKQLLYQIGTLTHSTPPCLLWRSGWSEEGDVLDTLHLELDKLAQQLDQTPREHEAVPLLGEIAAYLSDWHPPCRAVARRFAAMTSRVADELEVRISYADAAEPAGALKARQCLSRMRSLLCYAGRSIESQDVGPMVTLMVLINKGHAFIDTDSKETRETAGELLVRCHHVMVTHINAIVQYMSRMEHGQGDRDAMLSAAVLLVLHRTPTALCWTRVESAPTSSTGAHQLASYEAVGSDGNLYSINLLDGLVLRNGFPPSRLSAEVLAHALYKRTFGTTDFEVAVTAEGVSETVKPVGGCYFTFWMTGSGALIITEVDEKRGVELQLLDVGKDGLCGAWGLQLPVRLREMHSHWLCR